MIVHILIHIVLPIFLLIGIGAVVQRAFTLDLATLSKLNFYVFVPGIVFARLLENRLSGELVSVVMTFNSVHFALLLALAWLVFASKRFRSERSLLTLGTLFNNCGNYGIPFAQLAFGSIGVEVMALTMVFQNILMFTFGLWLVGDKRTGWRKRLSGILKAPVLYALVLVPLLDVLRIELPQPILFPLEQIANGLIPVALLTLGAQLATTRRNGRLAPVGAVAAMRLGASPLLAAALAWIWIGFLPTQAAQVLPVLVCAAGLPVAVNVYVLAMEYGRKPELASRMVFWSTLASAATLAFWLSFYVE
ncbi:AEC family transporter [Candidatus Sumerlaeota bacterium]|nr:AEC family transporter [Candidatus Sumerlaeota bacterium]